jgi:L,D-transpeptidase ErfK/SrfK
VAVSGSLNPRIDYYKFRIFASQSGGGNCCFGYNPRRKTLERNFMRLFIGILLALGVVYKAAAGTYTLSQGDVIGQVQTAVTKPGDTLAQVARDYDMGYVEMEEANPGIEDADHLKPGTVLVVPSQFVLPQAPRDGLVVNLAEMRLYYYIKGTNQVVTHPMGIGREGEDTPVGVLKIIEHIPNPTWRATEYMRKLRAKEGVILPESVPPGPENPLGKFAMRLSRPTFLIHGTNDPLGGIGRRSSSGCMRLYPEDIQTLFHQVKNGTSVYIINQPYKAGLSAQGELYLESHLSLQDKENPAVEDAQQIHQVVQLAIQGKPINVDWDKVNEISGETQGLPQVVGSMG